MWTFASLGAPSHRDICTGSGAAPALTRRWLWPLLAGTAARSRRPSALVRLLLPSSRAKADGQRLDRRRRFHEHDRRLRLRRHAAAGAYPCSSNNRRSSALSRATRITQALRLMEQPPGRPTDARTGASGLRACRREGRDRRLHRGPRQSIRHRSERHRLPHWRGPSAGAGDSATERLRFLAALGTAASELRSKLGRIRASLETYDVPLVQATTSSLEALQAYTRCDQGFSRSDLAAAIQSCDASGESRSRLCRASRPPGHSVRFPGPEQRGGGER